jgi:hypothetical protein
MDGDALIGEWDNSATLQAEDIAFTVTVHAHKTHTAYTLLDYFTTVLAQRENTDTGLIALLKQ